MWGNGFSRVTFYGKAEHFGGGTLNKKRLAIFFAVIISAALFITGCSGGTATDTESNQQENQQQEEQAATSTAPLAQPINLPKSFKVDETTPKFFKEALNQKQPIVVFFYSEGDSLSDAVRENIKAISEKPEYQNVIFLALNIDKPEHVFGLISPLGVTYTPFVALIDKEGVIVKEFDGYVDGKTLEQAIYNISVRDSNQLESTKTTTTSQ